MHSVLNAELNFVPLGQISVDGTPLSMARA